MTESGGFSLKNQPWLWIAVIITAGLIISTWIFTNGLVKYKTTANTITVTGSAKRQI